MGTYLPLTPEQEAELDRLIAETGATEVTEMVNVYEEKGMQQGMQQGVVVGQRQGLLCLLQEKFGAVPSDVASRVEAISDTERLTELLRRILHAQTIKDMGL